MWPCSVLFSLLLVTLGVSGGPISQAPSYGERGSDLGLRVFQLVARAKPQDNVVLSPHGVASILGMLLPGAEGETRRQIFTALRYKKNGPYKMLKKLHKTLTRSPQGQVLMANALFSQTGFPLDPGFIATNKANFQSENATVDFRDPQAAADQINSWVNNKTKGHIPSLVKPDMLDPALTRLLAVNSIYFKGMWKSRFQPGDTKMRSFSGGDGRTHKVHMMSQLSVYPIGQASTPQGLKYKVVELPYHGNTASMLIVLPSDEDTPLSEVIPHISMATVHSWAPLMHQRKVRLFIPKFTAEAEVDLKAPLSALGLTDMFTDGKADFRHLSPEPVHVSAALQKAKIEVNEDGTQASAATTAILLARSSPPWVIVDRPFLFLVRHNPTGQINQP